MQAESRWKSLGIAFMTALLLSACGGDGGDDKPGRVSGHNDSELVAEPGAPAQTGNTEVDGFNWFNYRRQQAGLLPVQRNPLLDIAARGHSTYLRDNDDISHFQEAGKRSFTGVQLGDRLEAAGYRFQQPSYAYGEVISAASDPSGFIAAEALITAIYHRFVILEPVFTQVGTGSSSTPSGYTWFTANFAADGLSAGRGPGRFITWPTQAQQRVPTVFLTDSEIPDPLPGQNESGYPISIHADITSRITVQQFTLRQPGGQILPARLLTSATTAI